MKKTYLDKVDIEPEIKCEERVWVEYYVVCSQKSDEAYCPKKPYGIEVVKNQVIYGNTYKETKRVENMFGDFVQARAVAELLHRNSVTPITVSNVLEDLYVNL